MPYVAAAAHRELRDQTPPNGDHNPQYFCPACGEERETRGDMRTHLNECLDYRAFIVGSVRWRDLEEGQRMTDHMHCVLRAGDLVVSTKRIKWRPPFELLRVASVTNDGWALTFRALDGTKERRRGAYETVFYAPIKAECVPEAATLVRSAVNVMAVRELLLPMRDPTMHSERVA